LRRRALPRLRRREDEAARSDRIRSLGRGLLTPPTWDGEPVPTRTVDHLAARTERSRPAPASAVTRQGRVPGLIVASARPRSWPATAPGPGRRRPHGRRTCSNRAANEWTLGQRTITYPSPVASDSTEDNLDNPTAGRESTNPAGGRNHCPRQGKRVMSLLRGFCAKARPRHGADAIRHSTDADRRFPRTLVPRTTPRNPRRKTARPAPMARCGPYGVYS
jgi:hypothetical protein